MKGYSELKTVLLAIHPWYVSNHGKIHITPKPLSKLDAQKSPCFQNSTELVTQHILMLVFLLVDHGNMQDVSISNMKKQSLFSTERMGAKNK